MTFRHYQLIPDNEYATLQDSTRAMPTLKPTQILIRVAAASLNYRDLLTRQMQGGNRANLTPLSDAAGTVVAVGSAVTLWREDDRVSPGFFSAWVDGAFRSHHLASALGGGQTDGVLSEYIVADETAVVAVPEHLSLAEAATLPCAGVTAWHALFERSNLQTGETVLVQGTGGVAMLALQLANAHGAKVIVTSSSDEKLDRARQMGAWQTINYHEHPDWDRVALELTGGAGLDHILELGGPETYTRSLNAIGYGGRIAQIGVLSGFDAAPHITPMQFKNASIHGICVGSIAHYRRLNQFISQHQIHPVIDQTFAYEDAAAAYAALATAQHFGKIVININ